MPSRPGVAQSRSELRKHEEEGMVVDAPREEEEEDEDECAGVAPSMATSRSEWMPYACWAWHAEGDSHAPEDPCQTPYNTHALADPLQTPYDAHAPRPCRPTLDCVQLLGTTHRG